MFAGCGGLSLGLEQAGFSPWFVNEIVPEYCSTYKYNHQLSDNHYFIGDINELNQNLDSIRHQKNMTNTQKRNDTYNKEGIIVNSYVKDPNLSLDETIDTLVISNKRIDLPSKVYEKEEKRSNPLIPICGITVGVMSLMGGFEFQMLSQGDYTPQGPLCKIFSFVFQPEKAFDISLK